MEEIISEPNTTNKCNEEAITLAPTLDISPPPVQPIQHITRNMDTRDNKIHSEPIYHISRSMNVSDNSIKWNTHSEFDEETSKICKEIGDINAMLILETAL